MDIEGFHYLQLNHKWAFQNLVKNIFTTSNVTLEPHSGNSSVTEPHTDNVDILMLKPANCVLQ